jgi:hypothetical protein
LTRFLSRLCGALLASILILPAAAQAAQITGSPLSVASADEDGRLGVTFTGSNVTEFYGSSVDTTTGTITPARSAGFVVTTVNSNGAVNQYGSRHGGVTATSAPVVSGTGTGADPFRIVQTFKSVDGIVEIRQELTYVNGEALFRAKLGVKSLASGPLQLRASMGADLAGGGSDTGTGLFDAGPPRFVGGFNTTVGAVAGLFEVTPWSHYEEGGYSSVLARADGDPRTTRLQDTVDPNEVDNGAAVQWDGITLGSGTSASFDVAWRFARTYNLTPESQRLNTGDAATFTVFAGDSAGRPQGGVHVRWASTGANTATGDVRTDTNGLATFELMGANPGTDRVAAYADLNDNGTRDQSEPQREATVDWTGPGAPAFGQQVNVRPVSGTVLIKLPGSAKVRGKWAHAAQTGFVRLTAAQQVPMGAQLDTSRGRVSLTSAKSPTPGTIQTAQFYSGRFQVLQAKREKGLTEVRMTGQMKCSTGNKPKLAAAASRRSRQLWGSGKGRFRTRGRNSSATVRGTTWLQKDTCTTTTTSVKEGVVVVKDFGKGKTVRVKAGKRYVARAKKR